MSFNLCFDTIVYHAYCSDGTAAAWAVWKNNKEATLVPAKYGTKLNCSDYENKSVAIVDFCFPRKYLLEIADKSIKTVVLDHHKTAERDLQNISHPKLELVFDCYRSGAQIAWDYMKLGHHRHWFIEMVADRDLWKWELSWSKTVGRATLELGFHDTVEKINELIESNRCYDEFIQVGKRLLCRQEKNMNDYLDKVNLCEMKVGTEKYKVAVCSCPFNLRSEIGSRITSKYPVDFAVMYMYNFPSDEWWLSFRTNDKSKIDVSKVAEFFPNGGGHPKAAGATIYGPNSSPPEEFIHRRGETMYTYLTKL